MMASGEIRLSTMTMRQMPVLAQSQQSRQQTPCPSSSDAAIVFPRGTGQGFRNTLSVPLAPGQNSLTLTVNNIDTSLTSYFMASTGSQVRLNLNLQAQTANGPFNTGGFTTAVSFTATQMCTSQAGP